MWFWIGVGVVIALVLLLAWRHDWRWRGSVNKDICPPIDDPGVGEARTQSYLRNTQGMGPTGGP